MIAEFIRGYSGNSSNHRFFLTKDPFRSGACSIEGELQSIQVEVCIVLDYQAFTVYDERDFFLIQ